LEGEGPFERYTLLSFLYVPVVERMAASGPTPLARAANDRSVSGTLCSERFARRAGRTTW
jgi:hypothetical protein